MGRRRNCCPKVELPGETISIDIINTIPIGKSLFVSATTGDDTTALPYRIDKMYSTIFAAQSAAVAGDTIFIYSGTYSDNGLGKNGINYYFYPGAIIDTTSIIFTDSFGFPIVINILGYGFFRTSSRCMFIADPASVVYIETYITEITDVTRQAYYCQAGSTINLYIRKEVRHVLSTSSIYEALLRSDYGAVVGVGGIINVTGPGRLYSHGFIAQTKQGSNHTGVITISCKGGILVPAGGRHRCVLEQNGGSIEVNCDIMCFATSSFGIQVFRHEAQFGYLRINGNVTSTATNFLMQVGVPGIVTIKGNITATSGIQITGASTSLIIEKGATVKVSNATAAVNQTNGTVIIQDRLTNLGIGNVLNKTGGTLILDDAKLVAINVAANSINCTTNQDIKIYSVFSNVNTGGAGIITNLITGTNLIVDTDVE